MSRAVRRLWPPALMLGAAVGVGLIVARAIMPMSIGDLRLLAAYMTGVSAGGMLLGLTVLRVADRLIGLSLSVRAVAGAALGAVVGLLNVLVVARLMFVNTDHDLRLLAALVLVSGIVTAFFSAAAASSTTRRVRAVASSIRRLSSGDYVRPIGREGKDEVRDLADDVDRLRVRLVEAESQRAALERERQELTAAVSHDLRTPIATVRAMVDALDDQVVVEPAEVRRYHAMIRREIERLSRMIDDLLELAQLDAGELELQPHVITLQDIAAEVVDAMQAQAAALGVRLTLTIEATPAPLSLDGHRMERAVSNLIRNALEYTPSDGRVDVRVEATTDGVALTVRDNGPGIAPDELPHIWKRFYRGDRSRHVNERSSADGAGLGLSIVRGVVELHGGRVDVESSVGAGSSFRVIIPWPQSSA